VIRRRLRRAGIRKYRSTASSAFCYHLTGCRETAGDVVQTTFLKAYQSLATLDDPRLFYYWLFSIARNEAFRQMPQATRSWCEGLTGGG